MNDDPTREARTERILRRVGLTTKKMPHNGTDTSIDAAQSHSPDDAKNLRAKVYAFIALRSVRGGIVRGATSDEAEAVLKLSHQTCSARFNELRNRGLIVDSGERRATRSGRKAAVYIVPEPT
jgi:hypothetical protein